MRYKPQTAGPALPRNGRYRLEELKTLLSKAEEFVKGFGMTESEICYRDKSSTYFSDINRKANGLMEVYEKDNHGDPKNPTNRQLQGLFFNVTVDYSTGQPPEKSVFGDTRVQIPLSELINEETRMYFADFYCTNPRFHQPHYVQLILTKQGSVADDFCRSNLIQLALEDNKFVVVKMIDTDTKLMSQTLAPAGISSTGPFRTVPAPLPQTNTEHIFQSTSTPENAPELPPVVAEAPENTLKRKFDDDDKPGISNPDGDLPDSLLNNNPSINRSVIDLQNTMPSEIGQIQTRSQTTNVKDNDSPGSPVKRQKTNSESQEDTETDIKIRRDDSGIESALCESETTSESLENTEQSTIDGSFISERTSENNSIGFDGALCDVSSTEIENEGPGCAEDNSKKEVADTKETPGMKFSIRTCMFDRKKLWIEVLYTENIDISDKTLKYVQNNGRRTGGSTGIRKCSDCRICNI